MEKKVPILLYHSVADDASPSYSDWAVGPELFTAHMAYLVEQEYTPLTVGQFAEMKRNHRDLPAKPVVISFDDGLADFYTGAYPILRRYNLPATLYIVTGHVGKTSRWLTKEGEGDRPMMTWSQIEEVRAGGIELGSHTLSHPQLDTLSYEQARREIYEPKAILENQLGQPIRTFAYPHGYHSKAIRDMVKEAGYTSCCAVKHAMSSTADDVFALSRIIVYRNTSVSDLACLLAGEGLRVAPQREQVRTKVWRFVRRLQQMQANRVPQSLQSRLAKLTYMGFYSLSPLFLTNLPNS